MSNELFQSLYEKMFIQLYSEIKNQKRGVLYTVIHTILESEQSQAEEICSYIHLKESDFLYEDQEIVSSLINTIFIDRQFGAKWLPNPIKSIPNKINNQFISEEDKMKWIIVVGCTIVGVYACVKYLEQKKENKRTHGQIEDSTQQKRPAPPPAQPITAALCLIVPALEVNNLKNGITINDSKIKKLIDAASYFLCTKIEDANSKQQSLETTEQFISSESNKEVYIRIHIPAGQEMIGKTSPYILKRNFPLGQQGTITKLACLKNLSGLETFNRI